MIGKKIKQKLLILPRIVKRAILICLDSFLSYISVWLSFGLRLDEWNALSGNRFYLFIFSTFLVLSVFIVRGSYSAILRFFGADSLLLIARTFSPYALIFFTFITFIGLMDIPRSIGVIQPTILFFCIFASRYAIGLWLRASDKLATETSISKSKFLIYGAGSAGRQLAVAMTSSKEMEVAGFIDDDQHLHNKTIYDLPVFGSQHVAGLVAELGISHILLAMPSASRARHKEIIASLRNCRVRIRTLPALSDIASGRIGISDLHDLNMNDLLGREVVLPNMSLLEKNISNRNILVTGAGGSIGSELCRQIIKLSPAKLVMVDSSEHALYVINEELRALKQESSFEVSIVPLMSSIRDNDMMKRIFSTHKFDAVFHAAAYKHVPLVEINPSEGIRNNVVGTLVCAQLSIEYGVSHFILISTDKAVRPTNIMGVSKRISELILQALADLMNKKGDLTKLSMVRFGNVLGSSGSVAPLFSAQIKSGGPITLTHREITRYFMTIPEAAQLVIQAGSMATGGDVFVLDMGQPVRIYDLALDMIHLSGLLVKDESHPDGDIEIKITGLRPGEKLYEELLIGNNPSPTMHPKIMKAHEDFIFWDDLLEILNELESVLDSNDHNLIRSFLKKIVPEFSWNNPGDA